MDELAIEYYVKLPFVRKQMEQPFVIKPEYMVYFQNIYQANKKLIKERIRPSIGKQCKLLNEEQCKKQNIPFPEE